jgi:hypothetical protein
MTKTLAAQAASLVLSVLATVGVFAGVNGLATHEYAAADALAMVRQGGTQVAVQTVVVVGHRLAKV